MLSLDAVTAGLVWQELFFRQFAHPGQWHERVILACAIWLAYVADRLFDNLNLDTQKATTERHAFIRRHWKTFLALWITFFAGSILFSFLKLPRFEFFGGLWIVVLINVYFLILRFSGKIPRLGYFKEILTGTLFAIGVSYFPLLSLKEITLQPLALQVLFGGLCFTNVLLISHWEHKIDRAQNESSLSQRSSNRSALIKILLMNLVGLGFILSLVLPTLFSWTFLLSSALLGLLYLRSRTGDQDHLKFLIDLPLIVPLLLFFIF